MDVLHGVQGKDATTPDFAPKLAASRSLGNHHSGHQGCRIQARQVLYLTLDPAAPKLAPATANTLFKKSTGQTISATTS